MADDEPKTISEHLEAWKEMEEVIGTASSDMCSFSKGYMARQAVFACLDCAPQNDSKLYAGFCYACSIHCHRDHQVEMLYTKRNFRCDCGTSLHQVCNLEEKEQGVRNAQNKYNHNYVGRYCSCDRPFPDEATPESKDYEMYQCIICEDWFHDAHLNEPLPAEFSEMACQGCISAHPFLSRYRLSRDITSDSNTSSHTTPTTSHSTPISHSLTGATQEVNGGKPSRKRSADNTATGTRDEPPAKRRDISCKLEGESFTYDKACFFGSDFRGSLCRCDTCLELYQNHGITFITDESDTLDAYDAKTQELKQSQDSEMDEFLGTLSHEAQCEIARAIGGLQDVLGTMLARCVENTDLTPEQIRAQFNEMLEKRNAEK